MINTNETGMITLFLLTKITKKMHQKLELKVLFESQNPSLIILKILFLENDLLLLRILYQPFFNQVNTQFTVFVVFFF